MSMTSAPSLSNPNEKSLGNVLQSGTVSIAQQGFSKFKADLQASQQASAAHGTHRHRHAIGVTTPPGAADAWAADAGKSNSDKRNAAPGTSAGASALDLLA